MNRSKPSFTYFVKLGVIFVLSSASVALATGCKNIQWLPDNSGSYLRNHTIQNLTVSSQSICRIMCYLSNSCLSCNFHESTSTCEINDSDEFQHPEDLIPKHGYIYTGSENGCQSNPCPSNSTGCQADFTLEGGYNCLCPSGFTGPSCNTDVDECTSGTHNCSKSSKCENTRGSFQCLAIPLTGSKENHATSCLNILKAGHSIGTGEYWIDPANTGTPIPAYCDMTTDGGGWTVVKKLVQPSNTSLPRLHLTTYEVIKEYKRTDVNVMPLGSAMLDIKNKIGFHQIHFYCRKVSVGRVVSIMTKNNTAGQAVVSFFTNPGVASIRPAACDSFDTLPDDTSILSGKCREWGDTAANEWGASCCMGPMRLPAMVCHTSRSHGFEFVNYYSCDNEVPDGTSNAVPPDVNDTWQISVR